MTNPGLRTENNRLYVIDGPCEIGRDVECKICLTDKRVSRRHASLTVKDGFLYIRDERSSNGTYVNGIRINRQTLLQDGDKVRLGDVLLRVEYPPPPEEKPAKTQVQEVTPTEDTGVTVPPDIHMIGETGADAGKATVELDEDEQAGAVQMPQRKKRTWRSVLKSQPWLQWAAIALGAFLSLAVIVSLWNAIQPSQSGSQTDEPTVVVDSGVEREVGVEGGQVQNGQGVIIKVPKGTFERPMSIRISQVLSGEQDLPALPVGLEALGEIYKIEWQTAQTAQPPLQVDLPLVAAPQNCLQAAYRLSGGGWQSLGGLIYEDKLRFDLDTPAVVRLAALQSSGSYGEYRPVSITNGGDTALIVRPWQWWLPPNVMTPGTATLSAMGINVQSQQPQDLESSLGESYYGYASLPYGTYSAWCVSWQNAELKQKVYAIISQPVSLTPYSCPWEDYRIGACEPEKAVFDVKASDIGNLISCVEAGKSP